jgi:glycosyltransferase involved in cell wall biosynthesis
VQVKAETMDIPSDIQFYIQTLNSFYELSSRYWTDKFDSVEFHLELGMWYWNFFNYVGTDYVDYYQKERLKAYKKDRPVLWEEVQHALFDYWCELSSNEELTFYENLSTLKIRILICGARFSIYNNLNKFLRYVSAKINMDIGTLE